MSEVLHGVVICPKAHNNGFKHRIANFATSMSQVTGTCTDIPGFDLVFPSRYFYCIYPEQGKHP